MRECHASARFGLGPNPTEIATMRGDPLRWLSAQVQNAYIPKELTAMTDSGYMIGTYETLLQEAQGKLTPEQRKELQKTLRQNYASETALRFSVQAATDQPFIERMVLFWSNHFTVSVKRPVVTGMVNAYEVQAIRRNITGKFRDMLKDVVRHPAMLLYLDNVRSTGRHSPVGWRGDRAINENLAREILELHTLGVDGGYNQGNVIELANLLTGWTLDTSYDKVVANFDYRPRMHEEGDLYFMGRRYNETPGSPQQGLDALDFLAKHPSTARHIARKLAVHFIADDPPETAVNTLAQSFLNSNGDLATVYNTLFSLPDAWSNPRAKLKTGYEFALSALRLRDAQPRKGQIVQTFRAMGITPFNATSPAGLPDTAEYWGGADSILKRVEWSRLVAQKLEAGTDALQLATDMFGQDLSAETKFIIAGAPSPQDALAFLLASPEFQRR